MALFEPEETIGKYWHRLVGTASTYRRYPEAAVPFGAVRGRIGVLFRALGGSGAIRIVPGAPTESGHRLNLKQRIGLGRERLDRAVMDESTLKLPVTIDVFPLREDNEALYEWLAAWFAKAVPPVGEVADPLQSDLVRLRTADATTRATLERWPGLQALYARLCSASLEVRPKRRLPRWEAAVDTAIKSLLGGKPAQAPDHRILDAIQGKRHDLMRTSSAGAPHGGPATRANAATRLCCIVSRRSSASPKWSTSIATSRMTMSREPGRRRTIFPS